MIFMIFLIFTLISKCSCSISFIALGDLHIDDESFSKRRALQIIVDEINRIVEIEKGEKYEFVMILGDLTKKAEPSQFQFVKEELSRLSIPFIPCMGNHDLNEGRSELFEKTFEDDIKKFSPDYPHVGPEDRNWNYQNFRVSVKDYHFLFLDFASNETHVPFAHEETLDWMRSELTMLSKDFSSKGVFLVLHHPFDSPILFIPSEGNTFSQDEKGKVEKLLLEFKDSVDFLGILTGHFHVEHTSYPFPDTFPRLKQWIFQTLDLSMVMSLGTINDTSVSSEPTLTFLKYTRSFLIERNTYFLFFEFVVFCFYYRTSAKKNFLGMTIFLFVFFEVFHEFQSFVINQFIPYRSEYKMSNLLNYSPMVVGLQVLLLIVSFNNESFKFQYLVLAKLFLRAFGTVVFYLVFYFYYLPSGNFGFSVEREALSYGGTRMMYSPIFRLLSMVSLHMNMKIWFLLITKIGSVKNKKGNMGLLISICYFFSFFTSLGTTYGFYTYWVMVRHTSILISIFTTIGMIWLGMFWVI